MGRPRLFNKTETLPNGDIRVQLTQNKFMLVNGFAWEFIKMYKWCTHLRRNTKTFYASSHPPSENGKNKTLLAHRLILGVTDSKVHVDHRNHDTLDNRLTNIRIDLENQNNQNCRKRSTNASGYIGISKTIKNKKYFYWVAELQSKTERIVKTFSYTDEGLIAAAKWRDEQVLLHHGQYAVLNFPREII